MNRDYLQRIEEAFDDVIVDPGSILLSNDEDSFWNLLDEVSFSSKCLIEIGTGRGISTILLSEVAEEIWTFDVEDYPIKHEIWNHFKIAHRIHSYIIEDYLELAGIISSLDFDAAFIDGNHKYDWATCDTFLLERCGYILFHDYHIKNIQIVIDNLIERKGGRIFINGKYAFWTNK